MIKSEMDISSRLKKVERRVKINHSQFCGCEDFPGMLKPRVEIVIEDNGIQTIKKPIPDFCERCRKPIEKRQIVIQLIESREQIEVNKCKN